MRVNRRPVAPWVGIQTDKEQVSGDSVEAINIFVGGVGQGAVKVVLGRQIGLLDGAIRFDLGHGVREWRLHHRIEPVRFGKRRHMTHAQPGAIACHGSAGNAAGALAEGDIIVISVVFQRVRETHNPQIEIGNICGDRVNKGEDARSGRKCAQGIVIGIVDWEDAAGDLEDIRIRGET